VDPTTWASSHEAHDCYLTNPSLNGIGFVLTTSGRPITVIDLDNAIGTDGKLHPWAADIIAQMDTYTELSPSGTGVHLFVATAKPPSAAGRCQQKIEGSGVEVYDNKRYVTLTGWSVPGFEDLVNRSPEPREVALDTICRRLWPDHGQAVVTLDLVPLSDDEAGKSVDEFTKNVSSIEMALRGLRCRRYLAQMPDAVSGSHGHSATFRVACELFRFGLNNQTAWDIFVDFNDNRSLPPWSDWELQHKFRDGRLAVVGGGAFGVRTTQNSMLEPSP
jgi:hypothetical protein